MIAQGIADSWKSTLKPVKSIYSALKYRRQNNLLCSNPNDFIVTPGLDSGNLQRNGWSVVVVNIRLDIDA
jgi:predicted Holliday junction resolvase-like endonuclease